METRLEAFREKIGERRPLCIRGGGSKDFHGGPQQGEVLDTTGYAGIIDYTPSELVLTARCGTPLAEINSALAARRQMLAFEPPAFSEAATIGGVVAAGLAGPRRGTAGGVRDHLLGVRLMDGEGRVLNFGGQVMKNVAGFDVSRLMAGSLGTLGLMLEVSLKVLPMPRCEATLRFELPQARAIEAVNHWAGEPLPISASCWRDGVLHLRLSGAEAAVAAACAKLGGEKTGADEAANFWADLGAQRMAFFAGDAPLWRVSVPSATPVLDLPGPTLIEWGGALRWLRCEADRALIESRSGAAAAVALFRGGDRQVGVFPRPAPAVQTIFRRLKTVFDPHGLFNRGRLFPDF
ncbi:MAG: glycolate oxidase subunit GlcE [Betaproteobacteria bacterium HGW-Betaproteobacteria-11]|nr:MAG: glycolate oxidase subunit GlcE [Betaproteobacteria bacterium HGW-Betaproteobacteria-11]